MDSSIRTGENASVECTRTRDGCLIAAVIGEIDHHSARSIRAKIDEQLYLCRPKKVRLELSGVSFMDSSGLGLILGRFTLARELGGELVIANPAPNVEKILSLAGTARLISTVKDKEK